jgi:hypothetical protein
MQKEDALLAGMRAQGILKPLMLRRTKDSKLVSILLYQLAQAGIVIYDTRRRENLFYSCRQRI